MGEARKDVKKGGGPDNLLVTRKKGQKHDKIMNHSKIGQEGLSGGQQMNKKFGAMRKVL